MYTFIVNPHARSGLGQKVWNELETILKKKNQKVGAGEKIIKLDLNYLRNENIDYTIMIVFLDTKGKTLKLEKYGEVTAGKSIITVM